MAGVPEEVLLDDEDPIEEAVRAIDLAFDRYARGILTATELVEAVVSQIGRAADEGPGVGVLGLVMDYARDGVRELAERPWERDRVLPAFFEERLDWEVVRPEVQARVDEMLNVLDLRLAFGDDGADLELEELCGHGWHTVRQLLLAHGTAERLVALAGRHQVVGALAAAVDPAKEGRLAHHRTHPKLYLAALDHLAHLAADPEDDWTAREARRALVRLVGFLEGAGQAAIRLPLHRLDRDDRIQLARHHDARLDALYGETSVVPLALGVVRDNELVRSTLMSAMDASRMPRA